MYDTTVSYTGAEYEKHFGLFGTDMKPHVNIPQCPNPNQHYANNQPSYEGMQQYLNDYVGWSADKGQSYWFMMYDTTVSYTGAEYEKHFGLFGTDMKPHVNIPQCPNPNQQYRLRRD
ncbi:Glycoside hydrolase [Phytophthora palmivora]|uniref:glucan endo-1,3-beta-D-glucosidase n=1 Tax=Phytophthora palmivora TaxID=4796 RepID=A0A2P4YRZ1_9STRA|nr:Glycoside hydrolase [Phytophthora palmivora]